MCQKWLGMEHFTIYEVNARLIMMYKMTNGLLGISSVHYLIPSKETRTRGSH